MKVFILIVLLLCSSISHAQWKGIYFHAEQETAIAVINKDTIATTTMNGRIHFSKNGGQSWSSSKTIFPNSSLFDIDFPSKNVGYACGGTAFGRYKNIIAKTTNGGQSWDSISANAFPGYSFNKIHFLNVDTGFVVKDVGGLLLTKDGGNKFVEIATNGRIITIVSSSDKKVFISKQQLLDSSAYIYSIAKSSNLGNNWTTVYKDTMFTTSGTNHRKVNEIFFVDNKIGYAVGGNGLFLQTTDGGANWNRTFVPPNTNLTSVYFVSPQVGFINNAGSIYRTEDAGNNWTVQKISPMSIIRQIRFANDSIGYAVGNNGIYKTINAGNALSISENKVTKAHFSIFPNPSTTKIFIKDFEGKIQSIFIYNQSGQLVQDCGSQKEINITHLRHGTYLLQINSENYPVWERFVKK